MAGKAPILAGITLGLTLSAAFIQPPQITVKDPSLLYTLALYKSVLGDTAAALRLVQQAEQSKRQAEPLLRQIRTRQSVSPLPVTSPSPAKS